MSAPNEHFIFSVKNDFFVLSPEEAFTLARRGMDKKPLNLVDFSPPLCKQDIYGFVVNKTRPISLDGTKVEKDDFWELILEILRN